ncbi:hypothetical protein GCM10010464_51260 [Pseudonocardia yunnanensis]
MGDAQRTGGERAGGGGGAGANAGGAGVVDGAGAAVVCDGTGSFAGRAAAAWGPGCGDVVSVQTVTSAPTPTTAVRVARAARVRARTGESGRCSSIATDTAAQPKIARVAMTTAHRWDTRYSLLRSAVRASDGISIILRRGAHHSSGGMKQNFPPFSLGQQQAAGSTPARPSRWAPHGGLRSRTVERTGWSNRIPLIRCEVVVRKSVMSISRTLGSRLASRG